jgi:hypothetical protein
MTRRTVRGSVAALTLLLAATGGPAFAQELPRELNRVAAAWHRGDASAIAGLGAKAGISLDVDGSSVGPLGPRQAAAVLRRVFEERESVGVRTAQTRTFGGEPPRAFGELSWNVRTRGTTIPEQSKVFVAFVREGDRWRVTEIRLLR